MRRLIEFGRVLMKTRLLQRKNGDDAMMAVILAGGKGDASEAVYCLDSQATSALG